MAVQILKIDCMEYMAGLPDKAFKLAVVDPPYGINATRMNMGTNLNRSDGWKREVSTAKKIKNVRLRNKANSGKLSNRTLNTMHTDWDFSPPGPEYFAELFRISENQIIWGGNYFDLPPTRGILIWDKMQPWENFSQVEMAWSSFDIPAKIFRYAATGGSNNEKKIHPTQKPIALYAWLFDKFLIKRGGGGGGNILDTHLGSGSSAIVAEKMGIDFVGCEIDQQYYNDTLARFKRETALPLFNQS